MRIWQYKIYLARHLGIPMKELGQVPAHNFLAMVREVEYQRRVERYALNYRLGQIMAILTSSKDKVNTPEQFIGNEPTMEVTAKMVKANEYKIVLGDGQAYELSIIDVNLFEDVEEEFDKSWEELFTNVRAKVVKSVLWHMLKRNYPELTKAQVGTLVTAKVLPELIKVIGGMT